MFAEQQFSKFCSQNSCTRPKEVHINLPQWLRLAKSQQCWLKHHQVHQEWVHQPTFTAEWEEIYKCKALWQLVKQNMYINQSWDGFHLLQSADYTKKKSRYFILHFHFANWLDPFQLEAIGCKQNLFSLLKNYTSSSTQVLRISSSENRFAKIVFVVDKILLQGSIFLSRPQAICDGWQK